MVLKHIPDHADAVVISGPMSNPDLLCNRDLYVIDIVAVPHGLIDGIGKTRNQDVLNRLFPQVMIDPVYLAFVKT